MPCRETKSSCTQIVPASCLTSLTSAFLSHGVFPLHIHLNAVPSSWVLPTHSLCAHSQTMTAHHHSRQPTCPSFLHLPPSFSVLVTIIHLHRQQATLAAFQAMPVTASVHTLPLNHPHHSSNDFESSFNSRLKHCPYHAVTLFSCFNILFSRSCHVHLIGAAHWPISIWIFLHHIHPITLALL